MSVSSAATQQRLSVPAPIESKKRHWWSRKSSAAQASVYTASSATSDPALARTASSVSARSEASMECVRSKSLTERETAALQKEAKKALKLQKARERRARRDYIDSLVLGGFYVA